MVSSRFPIVGLLLYCSFLFSGCLFSHDRFVVKGKGQVRNKRNSYNSQSIILKNYILFNTKDRNNIVSTNESIWSTDVDSLINVFSNSFSKLDLKFQDNSIVGKNFNDEKFITKHIIRLKNVEEDWIKSVAYNNIETDSTIILPFIYLYNRINFTGFIGSSGVASNNGFYISTYFDLLIYIIEKNEILYRKHVRYVSEKSDYVQTLFEAQELVEKIPMVRQEHWDELVRLTMKDYMKRMK